MSPVKDSKKLADVSITWEEDTGMMMWHKPLLEAVFPIFNGQSFDGVILSETSKPEIEVIHNVVLSGYVSLTSVLI